MNRALHPSCLPGTHPSFTRLPGVSFKGRERRSRCRRALTFAPALPWRCPALRCARAGTAEPWGGSASPNGPGNPRAAGTRRGRAGTEGCKGHGPEPCRDRGDTARSPAGPALRGPGNTARSPEGVQGTRPGIVRTWH